MSGNAIALGLHFLLELAALASMAYWGWTTHDGVARWAWAVGLPLLAAVAWAVFRSSVDPQAAVVEIPGAVRLTLEILILGAGAALLSIAGQPVLGGVLAVLILVDYALAYDRVVRLLGG